MGDRDGIYLSARFKRGLVLFVVATLVGYGVYSVYTTYHGFFGGMTGWIILGLAFAAFVTVVLGVQSWIGSDVIDRSPARTHHSKRDVAGAADIHEAFAGPEMNDHWMPGIEELSETDENDAEALGHEAR